MTRRSRGTRGAAAAESPLPPATTGPSAGPARGVRSASGTAAKPASRERWAVLDTFRGAAIVTMVVYHFCFDLALNGWLVADFGDDWRWVAFRVSILGAFLLAAGASLGLASLSGFDERKFWRRIGVIAGAALLVTVGSWTMFPESFIYFGVLHAIALMTLLGRPMLRLGTALFVVGPAIVAAGVALRFSLFDAPWLHWVGMMTFRPRTEDYVPLFPWFGVFLTGAAVASSIASTTNAAALSAWRPPRPFRALPWLGRHSLAIYLIHQPVLLGTMQLVRYAA